VVQAKPAAKEEASTSGQHFPGQQQAQQQQAAAPTNPLAALFAKASQQQQQQQQQHAVGSVQGLQQDAHLQALLGQLNRTHGNRPPGGGHDQGDGQDPEALAGILKSLDLGGDDRQPAGGAGGGGGQQQQQPGPQQQQQKALLDLLTTASMRQQGAQQQQQQQAAAAAQGDPMAMHLLQQQILGSLQQVRRGRGIG
jgi:hypothetical protein